MQRPFSFAFSFAFLLISRFLPIELLAQEKSFVVMGLAAHPDDEDGATLAYYASVKRAKTYSLIFTRGEGGQNEIGSSLYDDLAEIRTQETFAAAKIIGAETYFLNFRDFGFSKTAKETFHIWGGKDAALARLVYYIRKLRPDVMITNHDTITTKPNRQHGNHQAVGILAYEAFEKAADSTFHPEQLKGGVTAWQVDKLLFRLFRPDDLANPIWRDSLVEIDFSAKVDSNQTVLQLAAKALAQHRSQGMDKLTPAQFPWFYQPRRFLLIRSSRPFSNALGGARFSNALGGARFKSDLLAGLLPKARPSISISDLDEPKPPIFDLKVYPTVLLKELATEQELISEKSPRYERRVILTLKNRANCILPVSLNLSLNGKSLLRKPYLFGGTQKSEIADTLRFSLEKDTLSISQQIIVEATPLGAPAASLDLKPVQTEIALKPAAALRSEKVNIGLIQTYDNTLQDILESFRIPFSTLDSLALASGNLKPYSTIVLDLRAFGYRGDLVRHYSRLLEYARGGGKVVCFYHKPQDWNNKGDTANGFAPYPIFITAERVTQEDAPIKLLTPAHPLLNFPNQITDEDWRGWVQERSIYLPSADAAKTSEKYLRLLEMSDDGEVQPSTSLLWARYGKGEYIYTSLALYRQLRLLHHGATKLFFNLISR
jgi:LmbE family N-acetylglucosaminyl deacetylase